MKLKPAFLLILLVLGSVAFLTFLLTKAEKEKVCCVEKHAPVQQSGGSSYEIQTSSFNHLIASTRK